MLFLLGYTGSTASCNDHAHRAPSALGWQSLSVPRRNEMLPYDPEKGSRMTSWDYLTLEPCRDWGFCSWRRHGKQKGS